MIPEIIELIEENVGSNHTDINLSTPFLDMSPKAKKKQSKTTNEKDLHSKGNHRQKKKAIYWMGEEICKIYEELIQHNIKEPTWFRNGQST